jgi:hypothetical protein
MKIVLFCAVIAASAVSSFSAEENKQKMAEEVIQVMNVDTLTEMVTSQLKQLFTDKIRELYATFGINDNGDVKKQSKKYVDTLIALFHKELERQNIKGAFIQSYSEIYSAEELKALQEFYSSPVGRKIAAKSQNILLKEAELMQKMNDAMIPLLKTAAEEFIKTMISKSLQSPNGKK